MVCFIYTALQQNIFQQEKTMSLLELFPVALAVLGVVLRWYLYAPAKQQIEAHVAQVNAANSTVKPIELKRPNTGSRSQVLASAAMA